jgi:hypothetical protein
MQASILNIQTRINFFYGQICESQGQKVSDLFQETETNATETKPKLRALHLISFSIQNAFNGSIPNSIQQSLTELKKKVEQFKQRVTSEIKGEVIEKSHVNDCQALKDTIQQIYNQVFQAQSEASQPQAEHDRQMHAYQEQQAFERALKVQRTYPKTIAIFLKLINAILDAHYGDELKTQLHYSSASILDFITLLRFTLVHACRLTKAADLSQLDCLPMTDDNKNLFKNIHTFICQHSNQKIIKLCLNEQPIQNEEEQKFICDLIKFIQLTTIRNNYSGLTWFLNKKVRMNVSIKDQVILCLCEGNFDLALIAIEELRRVGQHDHELPLIIGSLIFTSKNPLLQLLNKLKLHLTIYDSILNQSVLTHLKSDQFELALELAKSILRNNIEAKRNLIQYIMGHDLEEAIQLTEKITEKSIKAAVLESLAKIYLTSNPQLAMEIAAKIPLGYATFLKRDIIETNLSSHLDFAIESAKQLCLEDNVYATDIVETIVRFILPQENGVKRARDLLRQISLLPLNKNTYQYIEHEVATILIEFIQPSDWKEAVEVIKTCCNSFHKNFLYSHLIDLYLEKHLIILPSIISEIDDESAFLTFLEIHKLEKSTHLEQIYQNIEETNLIETLNILVCASFPLHLQWVGEKCLQKLKTEKNQFKLLATTAKKLSKSAPHLAVRLFQKISLREVIVEYLPAIIKSGLDEKKELKDKSLIDLIQQIRILTAKDSILSCIVNALPNNHANMASVLLKNLQTEALQIDVLHQIAKDLIRFRDQKKFNKLKQLGVMIAQKINMLSIIDEELNEILKSRFRSSSHIISVATFLASENLPFAIKWIERIRDRDLHDYEEGLRKLVQVLVSDIPLAITLANKITCDYKKNEALKNLLSHYLIKLDKLSLDQVELSLSIIKAMNSNFDQYEALKKLVKHLLAMNANAEESIFLISKTAQLILDKFDYDSILKNIIKKLLRKDKDNVSLTIKVAKLIDDSNNQREALLMIIEKLVEQGDIPLAKQAAKLFQDADDQSKALEELEEMAKHTEM